jgi:hypothetical protein
MSCICICMSWWVGVTFTTTIGIDITVAALRDKRVSTSLSSYIIVQNYLMTSTQPMCSINRKKRGEIRISLPSKRDPNLVKQSSFVFL